jgi:hypothetical protein
MSFSNLLSCQTPGHTWPRDDSSAPIGRALPTTVPVRCTFKSATHVDLPVVTLVISSQEFNRPT